MSGAEKRVCVGILTGAQGVRGAVRIKSFTADPNDVARYGPLEDESGERHFSLRLAGSAKGVVIAQVSGVDDRDQAEALRGLRLYLPRAALPPPGEEEYYHADLIGLNAALGDGTPVGQVRAVHDFGAGDTLEIARTEGSPVLVPFTRAIVPIVDLDAGCLVLDPPPGLIDDAVPKKRGRSPHPNPPPLAGEGTSRDMQDDQAVPAPLAPQNSLPRKRGRVRVGESPEGTAATLEKQVVAEPSA